MTKCGYCETNVKVPCYNGKQAMKCSKDLKQPKKNPLGDNFTAGEAKAFDDPFTPTCDFCELDVVKPCKIAGEAHLCSNNWNIKDEAGMEGRKDDTGKVRFDLLPPELLFAVANILTFGAKKYNDRNWEKGMSWGRVFGACMRHMWAWWSGEKADKETGYSHLWHAGCCIAFLIAYEARGVGEDDRNKETK